MRCPAPVVALLTVVLVGTPVVCLQAGPWFGTWRQTPSPPARWYESPAYKTVTLRIEPAGDGIGKGTDEEISVIYDMVKTRGGVEHMEWTGRFDGRDNPVQGVDYVLTNAYRLLDERSYEIVIKLDGRQVATVVAVVSPDGRTMTVTTTERDPRGEVVKSVATYARIDGAR